MFEKDFIFGVSTSAYQIEGAFNEDGKGKSIWDTYVREKDVIFDGHTGDIACDHYHRFKSDVKIMKELGIKAYRFSLSWPRIIPNGTGEVNEKGIAFYNALIDELLNNDIEPYVTLFHWDLPYELYKKGHYLNREFSDWFAEYARVVAENFSDRVKNFITINEPQCILGGFEQGKHGHAPGLKLSLNETIPISHNLMLAHGKASDALHKYARSVIKVSYAPTGFWAFPATEDERDIEFAKNETFEVMHENMWYSSVSWFSDPIMLGRYPEDGIKKYGKYLPDGWEEDLKQIHRPCDYLCQNYYEGGPVTKKDGYLKQKPGSMRNSAGWPITPECIRWAVKFLYERYKLPIIISENGYCAHDWVSVDGKVHDYDRIDFIKRHLAEIERAKEEGVDVRGYFYWSIMDNFEWCLGYKERFGLVYVDYETQERVIKESGYWYKKLISKQE